MTTCSLGQGLSSSRQRADVVHAALTTVNHRSVERLSSGPLAGAIERRIATVPLDSAMKGLPVARPGATLGDVGSFGWSLFAGDVPTPVAVVARSALEHNARLMAAYCKSNGVSLAPHGKTTMAPQLVDLQLAHGAWAITAGTVAQTRLFLDFGVERVLLANEVTDLGGLRELAGLLEADESREVLVLVDSVQGVEIMDQALGRLAVSRPLPVLAELGVAGGRTGARTVDGLIDVASAVGMASSLRLAGVEGYEGVVGTDVAAVGAVDAYLDELVRAAQRVQSEGLFDSDTQPILSAGGSVFFDRVVERLAPAHDQFHVVLRSGCYLPHDHGKYMRMSPLDGRAAGGQRLLPALEVWCSVVSTPEQGLIVLNAGRRDLSFDAGVPVVVKLHQHGKTETVRVTDGFEVKSLMDQHSIVRIDPDFAIDVGDLVALGVSHPCTTFDKWRVMLVTDDDGGVVDAIMTFF